MTHRQDWDQCRPEHSSGATDWEDSQGGRTSRRSQLGGATQVEAGALLHKIHNTQHAAHKIYTTQNNTKYTQHMKQHICHNQGQGGRTRRRSHEATAQVKVKPRRFCSLTTALPPQHYLDQNTHKNKHKMVLNTDTKCSETCGKYKESGKTNTRRKHKALKNLLKQAEPMLCIISQKTNTQRHNKQNRVSRLVIFHNLN